MSFQVKYSPLFRVLVYHAYHLDDGPDEFNTLGPEEKAIQLKGYDYHSYLEISLSHASRKFLAGHQMVFHSQKDQIVVGIRIKPGAPQEPMIPLTAQDALTFILKVKDPYFSNYTDYGIEHNRLLYLSNVKPSTEGQDFAYIPRADDNVFITDDHTLSEDGTRDILDTLSIREKTGLLGCIKLHMQGDSPDLDILENTGDLPGAIPEFKIHFNNRKTFWKYLKPSEDFEAETQTEKPLTLNGFIEIDPDTDFTVPQPGAETYRYPNPTVHSIKTIANKTYSEIFI